MSGFATPGLNIAGFVRARSRRILDVPAKTISGVIIPRASSGPPIPHVADANARLSLTAEGVVVSGAGTAEVNGFWSRTEIINDRQSFTLVNQAFGGQAEWRTSWSGSQWTMNGAGATTYYFSTDDVATPDLVTTWQQAEDHGTPVGQLPLPTVTHSPGQVTGAGYQVTQDDEGNAIVHTFNGDGADADAGLVFGGYSYVANGTANGKNYYNPVGATNDPASFAITYSGAVWNHITEFGSADEAGTDADYPWLSTWDTSAVTRNPIASLSNWTP